MSCASAREFVMKSLVALEAQLNRTVVVGLGR